MLLRFATVADMEYVWFNRPLFVKGLNFVSSTWLPYFDPYSASVDRIDQWVRISRLPCEFGLKTLLSSFLSPLGMLFGLIITPFFERKGALLECVLTLM